MQIHSRFDRPQSESGSALIMSLFFAIVVTGIVTTGSIFLHAHRTKSDTQFQVFSQATQFARSGLTEALSWFRRQPAQPVLAFEPVEDVAANPPITDTEDPMVGIAREFSISGSTWGRYEVWKQWDGDPNAARAAWRQPLQATDVSVQRGLGASGSAWMIRSVGYLYRNVDATKAFDEAPNRVLATRILESEILRLKISPPGHAALCVSAGRNALIATNGRVEGGAGAGIFYPTASGSPTVLAGGVSGTPSLATSGAYDGSWRSVFGVSFQEIRSIADIYVTNPNDFPVPVPTNGVIVVELPAGQTMEFDSARPLTGSGLVVIKGNANILAGSNSNFTGLLYVDGTMIVLSPAQLTGAVITTGSFGCSGTGDYATVTFDDGALTALRLEVGQYRMSSALRPIRTDE